MNLNISDACLGVLGSAGAALCSNCIDLPFLRGEEFADLRRIRAKAFDAGVQLRPGLSFKTRAGCEKCNARVSRPYREFMS